MKDKMMLAFTRWFNKANRTGECAVLEEAFRAGWQASFQNTLREHERAIHNNRIEQ